MLVVGVLLYWFGVSTGFGGFWNSRDRLLKILGQVNPGSFLQLQFWAIGVKLFLFCWWWCVLLPLLFRSLGLVRGRDACSAASHGLASLGIMFLLLHLKVCGLQVSLTATRLYLGAYIISWALFYSLSSWLLHLFQFFEIAYARVIMFHGLLHGWSLRWIFLYWQNDLAQRHDLLCIIPLFLLVSW